MSSILEQPQNDHDLLILLLGEVRQVKDDIKDLKDNTKDQIADHEVDAALVLADGLDSSGGEFVEGIHVPLTAS